MTSLVNDVDELILKQKHVYVICDDVNSNMFTFELGIRRRRRKDADSSRNEGVVNITVESNDIIRI